MPRYVVTKKYKNGTTGKWVFNAKNRTEARKLIPGGSTAKIRVATSKD